jgi:hypothetical protein
VADVVESLNVLAKEVFGDKGVPDLIPDATKIQKDIPFSVGEKMGLKFVQTVRLAYPNGFTHAKGDGTAGAFTFQNAKPGAQGRAELFGYQTLLRDQMSYEDAAKLTGSKEAFKNGVQFFYKGLQTSMRKRIEAQMLYGGQGLGVVTGAPVTAGSTKIVSLTAASHAPGIWTGNEGMELDFYSGSTLINTILPVTLVSYDPVGRTITVSGNGTDLGNLATAQSIFYRGAFGVEMTGIVGILNNSSLLFNIDASVYSLWKSTQYAPSSGALTFQKVKKAIALGVAKGLDEDIKLYVNPSTWDDLNSDLAALRKTSKDEVKKVEFGAEEIVYHSQNGQTSIVPSIYVKEGIALGLCNPEDYWKRIGAADVSLNAPGFGGELFLHLPSNAGIEARAYTHQAVICEAPAKQFIITNIVNTSY